MLHPPGARPYPACQYLHECLRMGVGGDGTGTEQRRKLEGSTPVTKVRRGAGLFRRVWCTRRSALVQNSHTGQAAS